MLSVGSRVVVGSGACTAEANEKGCPSPIQMRVGIGPSAIGLSEYRCQPGWIVATMVTLTRDPAFTAFAAGLTSFQETGSGGAAAIASAAIVAARSVILIGLRWWYGCRPERPDRHRRPGVRAWSCRPARTPRRPDGAGRSGTSSR